LKIINPETGWIAKLTDQTIPLVNCLRMLMQISKMCKERCCTVNKCESIFLMSFIEFYHTVTAKTLQRVIFIFLVAW